MEETHDAKPGVRGLGRTVKSIRCRYTSSEELVSLFEDFRLMCNDAIRIAVKECPKNRFALIELAYPRLKEYGLHTHYLLNACEVAYAAYRNKNRRCDPCVKRAFVKLDSQSYSLDHLILRIPTKPKRFVYLTLRVSNYHLSFIDDPTLKKGSITLTDGTVSIVFSKEIAAIAPLGYVGVDVNERNVTIATTTGYVKPFKEFAEVAEIKERYRAIRAKISQRTRQDSRISKQLYAKFGRRERNRTNQRIHGVSKKIVDHAKANRLGIVMERLKGIRRLYRKGNGQGRFYRARMNSWVYNETQRQIEYKAKWENLPVTYINPKGTSRNCPDCGSRVVNLGRRELYCPSCDKIWDRDVLASKNIMACVVPQVRPFEWSSDPPLEQSGEQMDGSCSVRRANGTTELNLPPA